MPPKNNSGSTGTPRSRWSRPQGLATAQAPNPGELLPFVHPKGKAVMALADFYPAQSMKDIENFGSISFHAFGDSGSGTPAQHAVADAMSRDIDHAKPQRGPSFLLNLGDIVYGPDKMAGYANKFYRPNENYHNLIFAIPGNHDGEMRSALDKSSLEAYFENFCQPKGKQPPLGISFGCSMPNQPGAYWRFNCPFVDVIGLYSGTGEAYGAIAHPEIGDQQKTWLEQTLMDIATERAGGRKQALAIAVHHPPYASGLTAGGFGHPGNPTLLQQMDGCCTAANVWPDVVLSAHAHNYQRYMRTRNLGATQRVIPYVVAGGGGIAPQPAPSPIGVTQGDVRYENGLEGYGYLTVTVSRKQMTLAYTATVGDHRNIFETVTMLLATGQRI